MKNAGKKVLIYSALSLLGGFAAWPLVELVIINQESLSGSLMLNILVGGMSGMFIGSFIGAIKGYRLHKQKAVAGGMVFGAVSGLAGGMIGMIAAQALLSLTGSYLYYTSRQLYEFGLPLSRIIGWGILGVFVGTTEGVRSRNWYRIGNGFLGGLLGGLAGGFVSELLRNLDNSGLQRLGGLLLLGAGIGFLYSLVDSQLAKGSLIALGGSTSGQVFEVYRKTVIGDSTAVDVTLVDAELPASATIIQKKQEFTIITDENDNTKVNDDPVKRRKLNDGDVLTVGNSKFLFRVK